jgi:uncharacterized membrane protein
MRLGRFIRHATATHWRTRMLFSASTLDAIEQAIKRTEQSHLGEIRFAIETAMTPKHILNDVTPRAHALEVFAHLRVWDTEENRGFQGKVSAAEWEAVCRLMEEHFRAGRFKVGSIAGVDAIGNLLARHFPQGAGKGPHANQLPDRPTLL